MHGDCWRNDLLLLQLDGISMISCPCVSETCLSVCPSQLLRSSLVNNRTQAIICDDLGMTQYVINNDQTVKERIDNERNKVKDKADIIEGPSSFIILLLLLHRLMASFPGQPG